MEMFNQFEGEKPPAPEMEAIRDIREGDIEALRRSPANPRILPDGPTFGDWEKRGIVKVEKLSEEEGGTYIIKSLKDARKDVEECLNSFFEKQSQQE